MTFSDIFLKKNFFFFGEGGRESETVMRERSISWLPPVTGLDPGSLAPDQGSCTPGPGINPRLVP